MLPIIQDNQPLTMSSREIADLTQSRHDSVKRSMERISNDGVIKLTPSVEVNHKGQKVKSYLVSQRDSYIVVAQLSPQFTAALVDRWQELEESHAPKIPQTKREWIELALEQEKQLELAAPKIAFVDNLVNRDALITATQVAQKHGKSAIWLNRHLVNHDVYNKNVKRSKVFRQWFVDKGFGEMKQNEAGRDQALFTNAGEVWINELILAHGYK